MRGELDITFHRRRRIKLMDYAVITVGVTLFFIFLYMAMKKLWDMSSSKPPFNQFPDLNSTVPHT